MSLRWKKRNCPGWLRLGTQISACQGPLSFLPLAPEALGNHWSSMEPSLRIDLKVSAILPLTPSVFCYAFRRILTSALWRKDSGIVPWPAKIRHAFPSWTSSHLDSFEMETLVYQETGTGQKVTHTLNFSSQAKPADCPCCSLPSAEGATLWFSHWSE